MYGNGLLFDKHAARLYVYAHDFPTDGEAYAYVRSKLKLVEPVKRDPAERTADALVIWGETVPAEGTLVEVYLRSRAITLPIPQTLRFHPRLWHGPTRRERPAMVALVTDVNDRPMAIHRTYLRFDGRGKADVDPSKMALGPISGGAIRLGPPGPAILVGEGIETSMSGTILDREHRPAWAAINVGNLERDLKLPPSIRAVTFLADADDTGQSVKATNTAKRRALRLGLDARVAVAPPGKDFNDQLVDKAKAKKGAAND